MIHNLNKILKQCIPPICYTLYDRITNRFSTSNVFHSLHKRTPKTDRLIIIGNGPSFSSSFLKFEEIICKTECLMVNESALHSVYEIIRPSIYALVDPKYFKDIEFKSYRKVVDSLIKSIISKTNWNMSIIMPYSAKDSYIVNRFSENENLQVLFYEDGMKHYDGMSKYEAWDKNFLAPPAQTVLNLAVWLSIYWGYRETYIIGADTSWHVELKMDQQTNELYTIDTHFYDNKVVYGDFYDDKQKRRPIGTKLYEELFAEATALMEYCELRKYADWKGLKVYNASEYSWIDAFERKKLK